MQAPELDITLRRSRAVDFLELTKPRITVLVLVTTFMGVYLASPGPINLAVLFHAVLGTALVASGASALNQYVERELDGRMIRTRRRPLPDGRIVAADALWFSLALTAAGSIYIAVFVNAITSVLGLLTLTSYILVYTPLKTRTGLCTLVGAIPGAIPPMMGWTAVRGTIDPVAWSLFAILFLWQMPHFFAISWIFSEDYSRGGFSIWSGGRTVRQIIFFCCALVPVSLLPATFGVVGRTYVAGALLLGFIYLGYGMALALFRSHAHAHRLLRASVVYLPALLLLMMLDKV